MITGDVECRKINRNRAKPFILNMHYAQRMPSISYAYGAFVDNKLIGIITIGKPASHSLCVGVCGNEYSSKVFELNRLCLLEGTPDNTASKLVGFALRDLKKLNLIIVSYADTAMGHVGYIYQATNFLYTGKTKKRTDRYTGGGKHSRHYDKNAVEKYRVVRSAKHRYIYFTGDKKFKKEMLKALNYDIQEYPHDKNKRYKLGTKIEQQIIRL